MRKYAFSFDIDKLLPFNRLLRASYVTDRSKFIDFSPTYDDGHLEELDR